MKHLEERELELEVWEDRELDLIEFVLWSDAQLLNNQALRYFAGA